MVSKSIISTLRKPERARFLSSSHPMPPEPTRRMREERIWERRVGPRAAWIPRRIGGQDAEDEVVVIVVFLMVYDDVLCDVKIVFVFNTT